jgi:hypothetical protein
MPLYINRLTDGNSIIVLAADEQNARARAATLIVHEGVQIASCAAAEELWRPRLASLLQS